MSNLRVKGADSNLAGMAQTAVIKKGDITIGVIGIAEQEWFETFNDLDEEIEFVNEKEAAEKLAKELRQDKGCSIVIALTHQWTKNDEDLAYDVPGVDIVLGGHDHVRLIQSCKNSDDPTKVVPLIKSGHDFHDLSIIDVSFDVDQNRL